MSARLMARTMAAGALAAALTALLPARATSLRDIPPSGPVLPPIEAMALPAPSEAAAERIARRLGFTSLLAAGNAWTVTARLGNAALVWYDPATHLRFGLVQPAGVVPVVARRAPEPPPAFPVAFWEDAGASAMPHPNGATTLVGITVVTDRLDRACEGWWQTEHGGPTEFGPAVDELHLGARSRVGHAEGPLGARMRVRVIAPIRRDGLAARWLAHGGPRWVGVTVGVRDVRLAARRLASAGVRANLVETTPGGGPVLWVEPRDAGGALFEFVRDTGGPDRGGVVSPRTLR